MFTDIHGPVSNWAPKGLGAHKFMHEVFLHKDLKIYVQMAHLARFIHLHDMHTKFIATQIYIATQFVQL